MLLVITIISNMAKATITTKTGTKIVIEGTKEEVAKILSDFERLTVVRTLTDKAASNISKKREEKKSRAASDLIVELKEEGYFNNPKSLSEIAQALETRGYLYPTTTLSGVVLNLVKRRLLGRKKADDKWVYAKR